MIEMSAGQGLAIGLNPLDELHDLRMSAQAATLLERVRRFVAETAEPSGSRPSA